ncbi:MULTISPECIES: hypothetical protein [Enterobacter]|jgi:hypothetical protein|nr:MULTISPECIES: hypothetical protein [Enterobacter]MDP9552288.1 hypothetical protein [Enterobacter mori]MDP9659416.1 hypothetical protein [Enterobacter mori]
MLLQENEWLTAMPWSGCKSPKRFRKAGAWPAGMQAHARPDSLKE